MEQTIFNSFKAILSNPELGMKVQMDTLRTVNYSYPQSDSDVATLNALAAAQNPPVVLPDTTASGGQARQTTLTAQSQT
jgi:hypothetical protein